MADINNFQLYFQRQELKSTWMQRMNAFVMCANNSEDTDCPNDREEKKTINIRKGGACAGFSTINTQTY